MRSRILVIGRDVGLRAHMARLLTGSGYRVEIAEGVSHAGRIDLDGIALAIVAPEGLGPQGRGLIQDLRAALGHILLIGAPGSRRERRPDVLDAADEAELLARVAEALAPTPAAEPEPAEPVLEFAGFRLDLAGHSLLDAAGKEVALTHGEFGLLRVLVQRAGRVLSRDQLQQLLAGRGAETYDRSIDMQIVRLRRKIEPDPKRPTLIVTVDGSGYKFAPKVIRAAPRRGYALMRPSPEALQAQAGQDATIREVAQAPTTLAGPGARPGSLALPDRPSLVVLPFENMSSNPEQEYFADGITEELTTALSRMGWFFVIARGSAFTYKRRAVDLRQVGLELGVRYVLEGTVRKSGARLRITGELIEADTGAHLWADRFEGTLEDIFDLQDRISASVCGVIEPRLRRAEIERAQRKSTKHLSAYDCFLRGLAVVNEGSLPSMAQAVELFARAVSIDQGFAAAYGMGALCINFRTANYVIADTDPEIAEGIRLARLAVARGRDDPTALWAGGYSLAFLALELEEGIRFIERSLTLNPNSAMAWNRAGFVRRYLGDLDLAIECLHRAIRLSPVDPQLYLSFTALAAVHIDLRQYQEAVHWAGQAVSEQPNYVLGLRMLVSALALSGRLDEARAKLTHLRIVAPKLSLSTIRRQQTRLLRRPDCAERLVEAMRLAGLEE